MAPKPVDLSVNPGTGPAPTTLQPTEGTPGGNAGEPPVLVNP